MMRSLDPSTFAISPFFFPSSFFFPSEQRHFLSIGRFSIRSSAIFFLKVVASSRRSFLLMFRVHRTSCCALQPYFVFGRQLLKTNDFPIVFSLSFARVFSSDPGIFEFDGRGSSIRSSLLLSIGNSYLVFEQSLLLFIAAISSPLSFARSPPPELHFSLRFSTTPEFCLIPLFCPPASSPRRTRLFVNIAIFFRRMAFSQYQAFICASLSFPFSSNRRSQSAIRAVLLFSF